MSTIYNWSEPDPLTAADLSTADKVFVYDNSAGVTKVATMYDVRQIVDVQTITGSASNAASISGSLSGVTLTSATSLFLSAPTGTGIKRVIAANSSLNTAITIVSSGSFIAGGSSWTTWTKLGGAVMFESVSTSMWMPIANVDAGDTRIT